MPRTPLQSRSRATVDAIVEAGFRSVAEHGAGTSTREIARVAGISIGSLYEYFDNKEAVFAAMHQRFIDDVLVMIREAMPDLMTRSPDAATLHLLQRFGELLTRNDERYLRVARQLVAHDSLRYIEPIRDLLMQVVTGFVMRWPQFAGRPDLPVMAYIMINAGIFTVLQQLSSPNPPISYDQLSQGLADIVRRYLDLPDPATSGQPPQMTPAAAGQEQPGSNL